MCRSYFAACYSKTEINLQNVIVLKYSLIAASILAKLGLSGQGQLVRPVHIGVVIGVVGMLVLWVVQKLLCCLLF